MRIQRAKFSVTGVFFLKGLGVLVSLLRRTQRTKVLVTIECVHKVLRVPLALLLRTKGIRVAATGENESLRPTQQNFKILQPKHGMG